MGVEDDLLGIQGAGPQVSVDHTQGPQGQNGSAGVGHHVALPIGLDGHLAVGGLGRGSLGHRPGRKLVGGLVQAAGPARLRDGSAGSIHRGLAHLRRLDVCSVARALLVPGRASIRGVVTNSIRLTTNRRSLWTGRMAGSVASITVRTMRLTSSGGLTMDPLPTAARDKPRLSSLAMGTSTHPAPSAGVVRARADPV